MSSEDTRQRLRVAITKRSRDPRSFTIVAFCKTVGISVRQLGEYEEEAAEIRALRDARDARRVSYTLPRTDSSETMGRLVGGIEAQRQIIDRLREDLAVVRAERDRWRAIAERSEKIDIQNQHWRSLAENIDDTLRASGTSDIERDLVRRLVERRMGLPPVVDGRTAPDPQEHGINSVAPDMEGADRLYLMDRVEEVIRALRATDQVGPVAEQHWQLYLRSAWTLAEYMAAMDQVLYRVRGRRGQIKGEPMAYFYKAMQSQVGISK